MTMSEAHSAAETAGVQINESVPLCHDNVSEGGYDIDGWHAEEICDLQNLSDQSVGGVTAL